MAKSVIAKRIIEIAAVPTLADGLVGQIDEEALDIGLNSLDEIVTLTEEEIGHTIAWQHDTHGIRAEGAGAVAVGALLHKKGSA